MVFIHGIKLIIYLRNTIYISDNYSKSYLNSYLNSLLNLIKFII